ncbi:hypothetical protein DEM34_15225 [Spiribacter halobius]|uniref:Uncharacterized protein n=1 Tax=Sediminicurvatus halobius TaxID=2182432 RepID=A0A2U2MXW8_9GAMM|nr:hypothetical protein DEM34_15225 [Spiribacter halobius]
MFRHIVHGHFYNRQFAWPHNWRIPDELDAYALYQICRGLETATGKGIYRCFREQLVYSIIARQHEDGGWYHGEWTAEVECHTRLHVGGMHLLCGALEERECPVVRRALEKAAEFIAGLTDETAIGTWFLHDSLERSPQSMLLGPFRWRPSRVLGKSESNMLVLNTHLDTIIALERYARVTGDERYAGRLRSARGAAEALLRAQPLEAVYWLAYRLIDLTWKPPAVARRLPLPLRALKRITWRYLMPRMNQLRTRFPRLVMPTGFVDRAIALSGVSDPYQTVNLWDLVRYARLYPVADLNRVIKDAARYTQESDLRGYWAASRNKGHSLGFWMEALWHLCLDDPEPRYRAWLAEAVLLCDDTGYGLAPAVLGVNAEAIPPAERVPTPSPASEGLRVINLSRGFDLELIVVNVTKDDIPLAWETSPGGDLTWNGATWETVAYRGGEVLIPGRSWVRGRSVQGGGQQVDA